MKNDNVISPYSYGSKEKRNRNMRYAEAWIKGTNFRVEHVFQKKDIERY